MGYGFKGGSIKDGVSSRHKMGTNFSAREKENSGNLCNFVHFWGLDGTSFLGQFLAFLPNLGNFSDFYLFKYFLKGKGDHFFAYRVEGVP